MLHIFRLCACTPRLSLRLPPTFGGSLSILMLGAPGRSWRAGYPSHRGRSDPWEPLHSHPGFQVRPPMACARSWYLVFFRSYAAWNVCLLQVNKGVCSLMRVCPLRGLGRGESQTLHALHRKCDLPGFMYPSSHRPHHQPSARCPGASASPARGRAVPGQKNRIVGKAPIRRLS